MKILVNVFVPAIGEKYDVMVPVFLRIKIVTALIASAVENLSNHLYVSSGEECLCSIEQGIRLRQDVTLEKYSIGNGDHLIIM